MKKFFELYFDSKNCNFVFGSLRGDPLFWGYWGPLRIIGLGARAFLELLFQLLKQKLGKFTNTAPVSQAPGRKSICVTLTCQATFQSCARGLGITTLTTSLKTVPWCIVNLAISRSLALLRNGVYHPSHSLSFLYLKWRFYCILFGRLLVL